MSRLTKDISPTYEDNRPDCSKFFHISKEDLYWQSYCIPVFVSRNKCHAYEDLHGNTIHIHPDKHKAQKIQRIKELVRNRK